MTVRLTANEYLRLGDDPPGVRLELIAGGIVVSPPPCPEHSRVVLQLVVLLENHVATHDLGEVLLDVDTIFGEYDVRRPDILFFQKSRRALVSAKRLRGRPDLAVEVLSDSSRETDRDERFKQYAKGGVKYYWIVDPEERTLCAYVLKAGKYRLLLKGQGDEIIHAQPFTELDLPLKRLWWPR